MKEIRIFANGSLAVIDPKDTRNQVRINGGLPVEVLEATEKNLKRYLLKVKEPKIKTR